MVIEAVYLLAYTVFSLNPFKEATGVGSSGEAKVRPQQQAPLCSSSSSETRLLFLPWSELPEDKRAALNKNAGTSWTSAVVLNPPNAVIL